MKSAKAATTEVTTSSAPVMQPAGSGRDRRHSNEIHIGNQAMLRRLSQSAPRLQFKLEIGAVNDPLEAEADHVADQVMRMPDPAVGSSAMPVLRRKCAACEEEDKLQRKEVGAAPETAPPIVHGVLSSAGAALDAETRAFFEPRFGADLSAVRIHSDATAGQSARSVSALAYTVGRDIVFAPGQYQPRTADGQRLLAHELTHVAQQGAGGHAPQVQRQGEDADTTNAGASAADAGAATTAGASGATSESAGSEGVAGADGGAAAGAGAAAAGAGAAGAAGGQGGTPSWSPPSYCPAGFCVALPVPKTLVELTRNQLAPGLLAGIAVAVSPRVVPVWSQYLFGGASPQNFTSTFSADFTSSTTTDNAMIFLELELVKSLKATPPTFPPGATTTTEDIPTRIPAAIKALGTPDVPGEMDFSAPGEIPGNLAGGVGKDEAANPIGAKPSPFDDDRTAKGTATITKKPDGSMDVEMNVTFHVTDTVDLCPGDCGAPKEQLATLPMSQFEASGVSGDVPFTVDFPGPVKSFTIPAPGAKPAPAPAPTPPAPTPAPAPGVTPPTPPPPGAGAAPEASST